jgi:hypothetical protein
LLPDHATAATWNAAKAGSNSRTVVSQPEQRSAVSPKCEAPCAKAATPNPRETPPKSRITITIARKPMPRDPRPDINPKKTPR